MDTVRLARDVGDVSGLLPAGISRLRDIPHALLEAIKTALVYLSWEENLLKDEMPPRSIWTDGEALKEHFARVERKRDSRFNGGSEREEPERRNAALDLLIAG